MADLSIIIPVFREPYLRQTIDSVLKNVVTEVEVIPVYDGCVEDIGIIVDPRMMAVVLSKNVGMRGAINAGLKVATGKYIMKLDAHCLVPLGFDKVLIDDCKDNWLMVPRRYSIEEKTWTRNKRKPARDYHRLVFPELADHSYGYALQVAEWKLSGREKELIDDTMTFQGSCWLANRDYFMKNVGYLDDSLKTYGPWSQDQQEIGLKYWLKGGEVKVNKKTWYGHLNKRGWHYKERIFSRKHKKDSQSMAGNIWGTKHWMNNEEPGLIHDFAWYINKFWPVPDWPDNWQEVWNKHIWD